MSGLRPWMDGGGGASSFGDVLFTAMPDTGLAAEGVAEFRHGDAIAERRARTA
ncbi:hypothetical protein ACFWRV_20275 [Streptomyces sp. NPDC058576]|uniref:hypothetical protein n=1 Tax=Streptomyces sp. NPDC058576 TaxID=3346547 RepID=UPI00366154C0